jgi:hypothetical protein
MSAEVWLTEDRYIGCIGTNLVTEMAEAVAADEEMVDALGLVMSDQDLVERVEGRLTSLGIKPIRVSVPIFHCERWDGSQISPCELDDRPGRGFRKVIGVHT